MGFSHLGQISSQEHSAAGLPQPEHTLFSMALPQLQGVHPQTSHIFMSLSFFIFFV